ncbi:hypothetical protein QJS66_21495 [Kocuria rhizophila]|nr:hypothetical protein QJS66_21495 [Kocuria rhizophila]
MAGRQRLEVGSHLHRVPRREDPAPGRRRRGCRLTASGVHRGQVARELAGDRAGPRHSLQRKPEWQSLVRDGRWRSWATTPPPTWRPRAGPEIPRSSWRTRCRSGGAWARSPATRARGGHRVPTAGRRGRATV